MDTKTKSIINMVVAVLAVLAFILFIVTITKIMGFLNEHAFEMTTKKDGSIDNVTDEAWKIIYNGGTIKGAKIDWPGSATGTTNAAQMHDVAAFKDWLAKNVPDIAKTLKKSNLGNYQIDSIVLQNGEYQATIGLEVLLIALKTSAVSVLLKVTIALSVITWIAGIITSIIVKKARNELGITSGGANIVFAVIRITGIPFLITSIITHIAIAKAEK